MVYSHTISGQIVQLNKDICEFENQFKGKPTVTNSCSSDCYCRKRGNHKVTNSLYHKNCIIMKKNFAHVKKTDIAQPRGKSTERKEVLHLDRAQVEISLKNPTKDSKISLVRSCKKSDHKVKVHRKLVDTGSDPITIVEPKNVPKKCWSSVFSDNFKNDHHNGMKDTRILYDPPEKLSPVSVSTSSRGTAISSQIAERGSHRSKSSVVVRDCGVQCLQNGDINRIYPIPNTNSAIPPYNPVNSLQNVVKSLKHFKKTLNENNSLVGLTSIISDMDFALNRLNQMNPSINDPVPLPSSSGTNINTDISPPSQITTKSNHLSSRTAHKGLEKRSLEETCCQLQSLCLQLEETCQKLRKEKDRVTEQFFEKSRELEMCLKRELEYQARLNEANQSAEAMSSKLDQYTKSMEELSFHIKKLQAENKALGRTEEAKTNLISQLMEATKENENLSAKVRHMTLEMEKNKVLLDIKDQELTKLKSELRSIGGLVSEKMLENAMAGDSFLMTSRIELTGSRDLAYSSPDGSLTSPSKSWKAMSSILSPSCKKPHLPPPQPKQPEPKETPCEIDRRHPLESINHLKNELRDLFAQMKQQTELSETILPEIRASEEASPWSTITDSSDGYNSITENEPSDIT